jgi:hypothetical protein
MVLSFKILKSLYFVIFRAVQIFASRILARLEGGVIFANFRPGGPGSGAQEDECAIAALTGLLRRRLRGF